LVKSTIDLCACPRCTQPAILIYIGRPVCAKHWERFCKGKYDLVGKLNIPIKKSATPDLSWGYTWAKKVEDQVAEKNSEKSLDKSESGVIIHE